MRYATEIKQRCSFPPYGFPFSLVAIGTRRIVHVIVHYRIVL